MQRARRRNTFHQRCTCSIYEGLVHIVTSEREWRRVHLPILRRDRLHALLGTSSPQRPYDREQGSTTNPEISHNGAQRNSSEESSQRARPTFVHTEGVESVESGPQQSRQGEYTREIPTTDYQDSINPRPYESSSSGMSIIRLARPRTSESNERGMLSDSDTDIFASSSSRRSQSTANKRTEAGRHPRVSESSDGLDEQDDPIILEEAFAGVDGPLPQEERGGRSRHSGKTSSSGDEPSSCREYLRRTGVPKPRERRRHVSLSSCSRIEPRYNQQSPSSCGSRPVSLPDSRLGRADLRQIWEGPKSRDESELNEETNSGRKSSDDDPPEYTEFYGHRDHPRSNSPSSGSHTSGPRFGPEEWQDISDSSPSDTHSDSSTTADNLFNYELPYDRNSSLTQSELQSIALHDIFITHLVPRAAQLAIIKLFNSLPSCTEKFLDSRTTTKRIQKRTEVKEVLYDACINNCMLFAMYDNTVDRCLYPECQHPRWKPSATSDFPIPYSTFSYIPIIHRLRLWYSDKGRADTLVSYRRGAERRSDWGAVDYWSGKHFDELKKKGLFQSPSDLSFFLSTDGVKAFKSRRSFMIWPILLISNNLPPDVRFKRKNMLVVGIIPGPNNPKDIDSFLWPLVQELLQLERGVPGVWNAATQQYFILKAYVGSVGADMVGRSKLMGTMGNRATSYCEYCNIKGIYCRGIYCPIIPPRNPPAVAIFKAKRERAWPMPTYDPGQLPLRTNTEFQRQAKEIVLTGNSAQATRTGIKGCSILLKLKSIILPWSFPPDAMHLWYENIIPKMTKHWRGVFFTAATTTVDSDADDEEPTSQHSTGTAGRSPRKTRNMPRRTQQPRKKKFQTTDDPWNISHATWTCISKDIVASGNNWPAAFGNPVRSFVENCHHMSAAEWRTFTVVEAPIYMEGHLPDYDYNEFISLVEAITLTNKAEGLSWNEVDELEEKLIRFYKYYEARYYKYKWDRLPACLPIFHQSLHVAEAIRWCGPMFVYSQWAMERLCGMIVSTAKSRVATNRNIAKTLLRQEQKSALSFILPSDRDMLLGFRQQPSLFGSSLPSENHEDYEDPDGTFLLHTFLADRLAGGKPPDLCQSPTTAILKFLERSPRSYTLKTYERRCLREYLFSQHGGPNNPFLVGIDDATPRKCTQWRCAMLTSPVKTKVVSRSLKRANNTRNASTVMYEHSPSGGDVITRFGEVQYFFTVQVVRKPPATIHAATHGRIQKSHTMYLALLRTWRAFQSGRLLEKNIKDGPLEVILASKVQGLVGVFQKDTRKYIAIKESSIAN